MGNEANIEIGKFRLPTTYYLVKKGGFHPRTVHLYVSISPVGR